MKAFRVPVPPMNASSHDRPPRLSRGILPEIGSKFQGIVRQDSIDSHFGRVLTVFWLIDTDGCPCNEGPFLGSMDGLDLLFGWDEPKVDPISIGFDECLGKLIRRIG